MYKCTVKAVQWYLSNENARCPVTTALQVLRLTKTNLEFQAYVQSLYDNNYKY